MKRFLVNSGAFVPFVFLMFSLAPALGQKQMQTEPMELPPPVFSRIPSAQEFRSKDTAKHTFALSNPPSTPICSNPPSVADLHPFGHFQQMSKKDAASLSLAFGAGGGGVIWNDQSQVIVWRQGKTATCQSDDGKFTVVYGSEWDSAIAISQDSLSGKASFATIAANVEINSSSTQYDYVGAGYTNTSDWENANGKLLKDISVNGLDVTNYATFDHDFGATLDAAARLVPQDPPRVIGYAPVAVTADLPQSLAKGYALMYIARGKGCQDAISAFPIKDPPIEPTIRSVYRQLSLGKSDCDGKADPNEGPLARQLLSDIKIEEP